MAQRLVTVFGGSGFLGRHVVQHLAHGGARVRVAVRDPEAAAHLRPMGDVGQIVGIQANLRDDDSVAAAVAGAHAVINLVGILFESGRQTFDAVHARGAGRVAVAAKAAGAEHFVHISAIGADAGAPSRYGRTKAAGAAAVRAAFPAATIVRPSILFGAEDHFFNRFATLARLLPVLPLYGRGLADAGATRFQPVYAGDVGLAIARILDGPATAGATYEFGGPQVYSFRELMEFVLHATGRRCLLVPIPFAVGRLQAAFLEWLPNPPLTRDQLKELGRDNVVAAGALSLADLGVTPSAIEAIVPTYLRRHRRAGRGLEGASA